MSRKKVLIGAAVTVFLLLAAAFVVYKFVLPSQNTGMPGAGQGGFAAGAPGVPGASGAPGSSGAPSVSGASGTQGAPGAGGGFQGRGGAQQDVSYTVVKTETPHTGEVSVTSSLTGTVEAADVVHLYAKAAGDVTAVDVAAGDYVEAGQRIMQINTDQIASVQNQLSSAEVSLNSARSNLSRMQILYNGGDITQQEYEQYTNQLKSAELQYESAKINYDKQVSYSEITAPIAGRIESVNTDVYDHVNTNAEICVISGEGEKRITVYVSERMMQHLSAGDALEVIKNGKTYQGRITEISTIVDSATGLFKVRAELENTDEIATGSSVKVRLVTDRAKDVMLVPVDAIYYSGGDAYLYVVEDGIAKMRWVEVGLYDDEVAEIRSGLNGDETVVSTWSSNLYEGAHIRLYDEITANDNAPENKEQAGSSPAGRQDNAGGRQ